jgi:phosphate starvation-inducible membrane PsiE
MKFIFPQERLDKSKNSNSQKSDLKKHKWTFMLFLLNSSALYQIGIRITQYYQNHDRLPLHYYFFVGIETSVLALIIEHVVRNKSHRFKKLLFVLIIVVMIMTSLFIPSS